MTAADPLAAFEHAVYRRDHSAAANGMIALLRRINQDFGALDESLVNRLAMALATLLADPKFALSQAGFQAAISQYRWIAAIFAASALGHADHVLATLTDAPHDFAKRLLLHTPDSAIELPLESWWATDRAMTASFCLGLLAARFCGTPAAHAKREAVLGWLPDKLAEIDDLDRLPVAILHDAAMHCSYGLSPDRHRLRRAINTLFRAKLQAQGLTDLTDPPPPRDRPVMLVVLEWFSATHSIFRTHSRTLLAAREHFHLIGVAAPHAVDADGRAVFHQFIDLAHDAEVMTTIATLRQLAEQVRPDVLYMPSVGMSLLTLALTNLRLAPLQIMALGHPATSHSDKIDAVSVETDFVGDPACFSESLMRLPADGQPYVPSAALPTLTLTVPPPRSEVHIAVMASAMKLNPLFLESCAAIASASRRPVRFHFLSAFGIGLVKSQIAKAVRVALGDAALCHGHLPYPAYMDILNQCDLFLSPFPFGNTNGIVDALTVGLPGICLTGPEVFEHIDGALFARAGLPTWTVADSPEAYVQATLRLAGDDDERGRLRATLIAEDRVIRLFEGDPGAFGRAVLGRMGR